MFGTFDSSVVYTEQCCRAEISVEVIGRGEGLTCTSYHLGAGVGFRPSLGVHVQLPQRG